MLFPWLMVTTIAIKFPDVLVKDGCRLIHSPEKWASGAGIMLGVSQFHLRDVRGPLCYGKECVIQFDAMGQRFRLIGKHMYTSKLTVADTDTQTDLPHTTVMAHVLPLATGFRLVLDVEGDGEELLQDYQSALEAGLWPCVSGDWPVVELHPLRLYRDKLGIDPIPLSVL
jgi:hypothetical protein